jgi:hypothetical protein
MLGFFFPFFWNRTVVLKIHHFKKVISCNNARIPYIRITFVDEFESDEESSTTQQSKLNSNKDLSENDEIDEDLDSWNGERTESDIVGLVNQLSFKRETSMTDVVENIHVDKLKRSTLPCISYVFVTFAIDPFSFTVSGELSFYKRKFCCLNTNLVDWRSPISITANHIWNWQPKWKISTQMQWVEILLSQLIGLLYSFTWIIFSPLSILPSHLCGTLCMLQKHQMVLTIESNSMKKSTITW